jgi:hypothetical protein
MRVTFEESWGTLPIQNMQILVFSIIYTLIVWGMPFLLVSAAWWRYRQARSVPNRDVFLLRASMAFLALSELILLGLGAIVLANVRMVTLTPQGLGLTGVLLCAASLLIPLAAKSNPATAQAWRSILYANIYLVLLWPVLMLAH